VVKVLAGVAGSEGVHGVAATVERAAVHDVLPKVRALQKLLR
jgi:hypothetical protein